MNRKGVNYDVGIFVTQDFPSRETFDPVTVQREIEIIHRDLHCNTIRITGYDLNRLTTAAELALQAGLEVWLTPGFIDANEADMLAYYGRCAQAAETLRQRYPSIIFVTGWELSVFMAGFLDGQNAFERFRTLINPLRLIKSTLFKGSFQKKLNTFLAKATRTVRQHFHGQVAYASGPWEDIDWSPFDVVGIDYYRDAFNKNTFVSKLRTYFNFGKPVVITEFGCCTYTGASEKGGYGWAIVDRAKRQLKGAYERNEHEQAQYIGELLDIFQAEKVDGVLVFTFVSESYPYNENPLDDLDMASYSLVKSYPDKTGVTYPTMPWEPKESFATVAEAFASSELVAM